MAPVVTYAALLDKLVRWVDQKSDFRRQWSQQHAFIAQMQRYFVKGRPMDDAGLVEFIDVLCKTGEARHFGTQKHEDAAINFGDHLRAEAVRRFGESRELLRRVKRRLRDYGEAILSARVNAALDQQYVGEVSARYQGSYEWTVNFFRVGENQSPAFQLKFGPSAWYALANPVDWAPSEASVAPDYTHLFLARNKRVRQSVVTLQEVLNGLSPDDTRLLDEVCEVIKEGP